MRYVLVLSIYVFQIPATFYLVPIFIRTYCQLDWCHNATIKLWEEAKVLMIKKPRKDAIFPAINKVAEEILFAMFREETNRRNF